MPGLFELFILPDNQAVALRSIAKLGKVGWMDVSTGTHWLFQIHTRKNSSYNAIYKTEFEALTQRAILHLRIMEEKDRDPDYIRSREW